METTNLLKYIDSNDFTSFQEEWSKLKGKTTEKERQNLLTEILDEHFDEKRMSFFIKVFDEIIWIHTSLDFNIDNWPPTFLSLAVHKSSKRMFDYLLRKGANLNFIGDSFANYSEKEIEFEEKFSQRYSTCLDFAQLKLDDMLTVDYNFIIPKYNEEELYLDNYSHEDKITISKPLYYDLIQQSIYLNDLIITDRLVDEIKSLGGKCYEELKT